MTAGRPRTAREPILAALDRCPDPLGATHAYLAAESGVALAVLKTVVYKMNHQGEIFSVNCYKDSRYFLTEERRDFALPQVLVYFAEVKRQRAEISLEGARRRDRARGPARAAKAAAARALAPPKPQKEPKPPKPPKVAKPKAPPKPKPVRQPKAGKDLVAAPRPAKPGPPKWADMEAIRPPGLKVTQCPNYQSRSFEPPQWFKGEFQNDWLAKRGTE